jgi:subtilisin family serine protease
MTTTTQRRAWFVAALIALAMAASTVNAEASDAFVPYSAATHSLWPPLKIHRHMQWYRWHPGARSLQGRASKFGSTAVIGLESMRDLAALRKWYGFDRVIAIPALHAVQVSVDAAQLNALLANAPNDPRVRYVSPVGPTRRVMSMPNDPFLHMIDGQTGLPYEWAFAASRVDRALDFSQGSPGIVVGVIDTGAANVPDLAGKIDGIWSVSGTQVLEISLLEGNDDFGHGTAVASVIAANVDDGYGMAGFGGKTHVIVVHAGSEGTSTTPPSRLP